MQALLRVRRCADAYSIMNRLPWHGTLSFNMRGVMISHDMRRAYRKDADFHTVNSEPEKAGRGGQGSLTSTEKHIDTAQPRNVLG